MDDNLYLTGNSLLGEPHRLWKAWFEPGSFIEYYPVTESVQWVQWQLWHGDVFGYHICNLVLHLINALLVWRLLAKFDLRFAWLGGLIFVVHPMQIESVGWIAELKNTLSLTPFLLAICFYLDFDLRRRRSDYVLALGCFLLAMLCKISVALFPATILLYFWWRRGGLQVRDWIDVIPFLIVSLVLVPITVWSGHHYELVNHIPSESIALRGMGSRLTLMGLTTIFYLGHAIFPFISQPVYPLWSLAVPPVPAWLPWLVLLGTVGIFYHRRTSFGRHAILGLGFFLINLGPFLGVVAVSYMNSTWVMDHFVYFPLIGLVGLAVACLQSLDDKISNRYRPMILGSLAILMGLFAVESRAYAVTFADPLKLWPYAIAHDPGSWTAHYKLATSLPDTAEEQARKISEYETTLRLNPQFGPAYNNWGSCLLEENRPLEAANKFEQSIQAWPKYGMAHFNLGLAWVRLNRTSEAISEFNAALQCNPRYAEADYNLGHLYFQEGRVDEAVAACEQAVKLSSDNPVFQFYLANVLNESNRFSEAIPHYEAALQLNPDYPEAHSHLGSALLQMGEISHAKDEFVQALRLKPDYADAHVNLGTMLYKEGDLKGSIQELEKALAVNPNLVTARMSLGGALYQDGQKEESARQIQEALLHAGANTSSDSETAIKTEAQSDHQ